MTTWPEFYFDSEFESASQIHNATSQLMELCPAAVQIMELAEAYIMATRAIHTHRTSFLTLKPWSQRTQLIATAKALANCLVFDLWSSGIYSWRKILTFDIKEIVRYKLCSLMDIHQTQIKKRQSPSPSKTQSKGWKDWKPTYEKGRRSKKFL